MKDIKSLYLTAKSSGKPKDISSYTEAIQDLINNDPNTYVTQLEYIISSDIGLRTLKPFIEKNGFSIGIYDDVIKCLNECIRKCEIYGKDASLYNEAVHYFEEFRKNHIHAFMMYENFSGELSDNYVKAYYSKTNGNPNRKLIVGMINKFGESAIADALITAESIDEDAVDTTLNYLADKYSENNSTMCEWVLELYKDIPKSYKYNESMNRIKNNSLSAIVESVKKKEHSLYRESVIMDRDDLIMEYSEKDLSAIQDMISFNEYKVTWSDEITESSIMDIQKEIYSLYEMMDGIIDEDTAVSVGGMLPGARDPKAEPIDEALWMVNTHNKKTGEIPNYLKQNHDLDYGETEPVKKKVSEPNDEPTLDDYRRPSAAPVGQIPSAYDDTLNNHDEPENDTKLTPSEQQAINNYYYYTYTNSMNRNQNSFNKDNSTRKDDHSVTSKDSHNITNTNSHNTTTTNDDEDSDDYHEESSKGVDWIKLSKPTDLPKEIRDGAKAIYDQLIQLIHDNIFDEDPYKCFKKLFPTLKDNFKFSMIPGSEIYHVTDKDSYTGYISITGSEKANFLAVLSNMLYKVAPEEKEYMDEDKTEPEFVWKSMIKKVDKELNKFATEKYDWVDDCGVDTEHWDNFGINLKKDYVKKTFFSEVKESSIPWELNIFDKPEVITEAVGDADKDKPESDHPIKDILTDIDRKTTKKQQSAKKKVQNVQNVARAAMKPINRTKQWIGNMVSKWKDADENKVKERMADPHTRNNLFSAIHKSIVVGSLAKAGLLLNPVFIFLSATRHIGKHKREFRIRNEIIGELKTELKILDEKIQDADRKGDNSEKYKLMRFKNELNKKLIRVGGTKEMTKMI